MTRTLRANRVALSSAIYHEVFGDMKRVTVITIVKC